MVQLLGPRTMFDKDVETTERRLQIGWKRMSLSLPQRRTKILRLMQKDGYKGTYILKLMRFSLLNSISS